MSIILLTGVNGVSACEMDTELLAGQDTVVGNVHVVHYRRTDDYIKITYETTNGWELTETHVAVATSFEGIPQTNVNKPNKPHNPKVGKFPYSDPHPPVTKYTYTIDLDDHMTPSNGVRSSHGQTAGWARLVAPTWGEFNTWRRFSSRHI